MAFDLITDDAGIYPVIRAMGEIAGRPGPVFELGLGRARVLSAEGRDEAAQRWYDGENGPSSDIARKAPAPCATCGYFLPMAGVLRQQFGVCANDWSPADGKVVALDFGCGAHSDVVAPERDGDFFKVTSILGEEQ